MGEVCFRTQVLGDPQGGEVSNINLQLRYGGGCAIIQAKGDLPSNLVPFQSPTTIDGVDYTKLVIPVKDGYQDLRKLYKHLQLEGGLFPTWSPSPAHGYIPGEFVAEDKIKVNVDLFGSPVNLTITLDLTPPQPEEEEEEEDDEDVDNE